MAEIKSDVTQLIHRYEMLKRQWFDRRPKEQRDENGDVVSISASMSKGQLSEMFESSLRCEPPMTPNERVIRFLDGTELDYSGPKPVWKDPSQPTQ